jgi:hypothetical protein
LIVPLVSSRAAKSARSVLLVAGEPGWASRRCWSTRWNRLRRRGSSTASVGLLRAICRSNDSMASVTAPGPGARPSARPSTTADGPESLMVVPPAGRGIQQLLHAGVTQPCLVLHPGSRQDAYPGRLGLTASGRQQRGLAGARLPHQQQGTASTRNARDERADPIQIGPTADQRPVAIGRPRGGPVLLVARQNRLELIDRCRHFARHRLCGCVEFISASNRWTVAETVVR